MIFQKFFLFSSLFALFLMASFQTYSAVTNISLQDLIDYMNNEYDDKLNFKVQEYPMRVQPVGNTTLSTDVIEGDLVELKKVRVTATGYTAGIESTGKTEAHPAFRITHSGVEVRRDVYSTIAADIAIFPFGTILYIPEYGYGVVTDTGSAIKGNKIDLYFEEVSDVYQQWGKKEVDVYVIKEGDGTITEDDLDLLNQINTEVY